MRDPIERQKAIDVLLKLQRALQLIEEPKPDIAIRVTQFALREIEQLPSAQPKIIRCKDCKYWQDQEEGIVEVPICARPQNKYEKFPLVMLIDGDGFCSYAERRADETY